MFGMTTKGQCSTQAVCYNDINLRTFPCVYRQELSDLFVDQPGCLCTLVVISQAAGFSAKCIILSFLHEHLTLMVSR